MDALRRLDVEVPPLRSPSLIIGLAGWTNAGEVATGSVSYLRDMLRARKFAEIDGDDFYEYTTSRPTVAIESGKVRSLTYPTTELYYWSNPDAPQDLLLAVGVEPDLHWKAYIAAILDLAAELGVARLCTLGGYYDQVPHTGTGLTTGACMDAALSEEMKRLEIEPSTYFGPTGMVTSLIWEANKRSIPAASVWGKAPHYIQIPNPRLQHEVLWRVLALCGLRIDLAPLRKRGDQLVQKINEALKDNPQLKQHIAELESQNRMAQLSPEPLQQEDILKSVEDFLRRPDQSESMEDRRPRLSVGCQPDQTEPRP